MTTHSNEMIPSFEGSKSTTTSMIGSIFSSLVASSVANMAGTIAGHPLDTMKVSFDHKFYNSI